MTDAERTAAIALAATYINGDVNDAHVFDIIADDDTLDVIIAIATPMIDAPYEHVRITMRLA